MITNLHLPIMTQEILKQFKPAPGKVFLDATFGDGRHSQELLKKGATVIAFDQDIEAIDRGRARILETSPSLLPHLSLIHSSFTQLDAILSAQKVPSLDGALFDLGVSTHQLLEGSRGFSFNQEAPLDMRMDQQLGVTAADLINALGPKELTRLFQELSDEPFAPRIARAIVKKRKEVPITTTSQLAHLISAVKPKSRTHPATQVFQALRMAVNLEREAIQLALPQAVAHLKAAAPLAVISFHSVEDRLVKQTLHQLGQEGLLLHTNDKPLCPSEVEINNNPRARSAKLRISYKL